MHLEAMLLYPLYQQIGKPCICLVTDLLTMPVPGIYLPGHHQITGRKLLIERTGQPDIAKTCCLFMAQGSAPAIGMAHTEPMQWQINARALQGALFRFQGNK